ncbi:MAG: hypothetical protein ACRKGH_00390 [Dehalogenimonas sp.]
MKKLVLVFSVMFLLSFHPLTAAEADGSITGQVINGSPNGGPVEELSLILEGYAANANEPIITETVADGDGNFTFTGLNTDPAITYYVTAEYLGITYYSEAINYPAAITDISVELLIYETTQSNDGITIALSHTIIYLEDDGLSFTEFFIIENSGNNTFIGSGQVVDTSPVTLMFPIPSEAEHIEIGEEIAGNVVFTNAGLVYTGPVRPGYTPATYSYYIHNTQAQFIFNRQLEYPQASYELLVQGFEKIIAPQLTRNEPLVIEDVTYEYFSGTNIASGEALSIELSGLRSNTVQTVLWVGGALVLLVAGFVFLLRRGGGSNTSDEPDRREELLLQIARLDDEYESGDIDETEYRTQRSELKNAILKMVQPPEDKG